MFTFNKEERLKKRKVIDELFNDGIKIKEPPLLFYHKQTEHSEDVPLQMAFSVSSKRIKSAVKRNRIKRQMREVFRLEKNRLFILLKNNPKKYSGMLIYTSSEMPEYHQLKEKIILILERYIENVTSHIS